MGGIHLPALMLQHAEVFACPACGGGLRLAGDRSAVDCTACGRGFECAGGIPRLFWPTDGERNGSVTEDVKRFYEEHPFPSYEDTDSPARLREKAERGMFARLLDAQIPHGARILEVGCGTGQLSNFLALRWGRTVFATDICLHSLALGHEFKERHGIANVGFFQMNLFKPIFRPGTFDVVIANGVLHHTHDPFLGFRRVAALLRPQGRIIVGLYNAFGRVPTKLRRLAFRATRNRLSFLDPRLRDRGIGAARREAWFMDQYRHPHESTHTMDEVLAWFRRCGVEFLNSIPKAIPGMAFSPQESLFQAAPAGSRLGRVVVQLGMALGGGSEGGFFIMIGRKPVLASTGNGRSEGLSTQPLKQPL